MNRLRAAIADATRIDPRSSFRSLYFNRVWVYGAVTATFAGAFAGSLPLSLLGVLLLASAGIGALWNRSTLSGVTFDRKLSSDRAFPADVVILEISVTNRRSFPVPSIRIDEMLGEQLVPIGFRSTIDSSASRRLLHLSGSLRAHQRVTWSIPLECRARGAHGVGPATIRSGDPFGFFASREELRGGSDVLVYPRLFEIDDQLFPMRQPLGEHNARNRLVTDPVRVSGVRDYRAEDPFRSIHWKATARHSRVQVKIEDPVADASLMILLNLDTFDHFWEGLDLVGAERSIETAASIVTWALARRMPAGLRANGLVAGSDQALRIPVGRGPGQERAVMTGLARLWAYSTMPFAEVMAMEMPHIPWGCTVVVVSPMMSAPIESELSRFISRGRSTVFVPVGEVRSPLIPGLVVTPEVLPGAQPLIAEPAA